MTEDEARALIASLIPVDSPVSQAEKLEIVREAGGSPFLLDQMARSVVIDETGRDRLATFVEMLEGRVRALPPGAQRFLETLAICGRPVAPDLVYEACGLAGDERPLVALLRSDRFLRSSGSAQRIEIYHDRIREKLAALVSPDDQRRIHGLMVRALVARRADDPEALYSHYRGAGDHGRPRPRRPWRRGKPMPPSPSIGPRRSIVAPSSSRQILQSASSGSKDWRSR